MGSPSPPDVRPPSLFFARAPRRRSRGEAPCVVYSPGLS
jgi:hypothetical protein